MRTVPYIAIVAENSLIAIGLRTIIHGMIPDAEVQIFNDFHKLPADTEHIAHYFIEANILLSHTSYFEQRHHQTIVLAASTSVPASLASYHVLPLFQGEEEIIKQLLRLEQSAHQDGRNLPTELSLTCHQQTSMLTDREIEVLTLIVEGHINKEIADKLNISLTTVISHRKKIMDKLNLRNVPALTIYAVMNGYVRAEHF